MSDQLTKILAYHQEIRIVVVEGTKAVNEAVSRHQTWHTASAVLGRTMMGACLLAANLKGQDNISVLIKGQGPVGQVQADADGKGHVRAFVSNPHVALDLNPQGKLDVKGAIGLPGMLSVKKQIANETPFVGQVNLVSGEIAEDFTYYMAVSEQTPSSIGLSVLVRPDESIQSAGGFMVQVMPGAQEETIASLEEAVGQLSNLSGIFQEEDPVSTLMSYLCPSGDYKMIDQYPIQFKCPCSKDKFSRALSLISVEDLQAMIEEDHGAETICHYCQEEYNFSENELKELIEEKAGEEK